LTAFLLMVKSRQRAKWSHPTPLLCTPRSPRAPSAASSARIRNVGSRIAQECGRDIVGKHTRRPFRLSLSRLFKFGAGAELNPLAAWPGPQHIDVR